MQVERMFSSCRHALVAVLMCLAGSAGLPGFSAHAGQAGAAAGGGASASGEAAARSAAGDGASSVSTQPVVYMAQQEYPEQIIRNLAYAQGFALAPGGTDRARRAMVTGRLSAGSLTELIAQLGRNHGFDHFIHGASIYLFDPSDWKTETVYLGFRPDEGFRDNLSQYGLLNPRFKLLPKPEQESLVITAPRQYIALLERILKTERDLNQQDMMVFRLRYASVDDRVITLRDRQVVTPGVATLLRGILGTGQQTRGPLAGADPAQQASGGLSLMPGMASASPMAGALGPGGGASPMQAMTGMAGGAGSEFAAPDARGGGGQASGGVRQTVSVQADARTNSIIIRDRPSREPAYRKLIDTLDVPLDMVEIEAVLIDIDQRRLDELGVQWSARTNHASAAFPASATLGALGIGGSSAVVTDRNGFVARLQALMADNDARVLARPTILTLDNLSGVIDLTQTFFTKVQGERVANVVPVVAGSLLRVSPRIVRDPAGGRAPEIQLQVDIEDGSLKDREGLELPTVQKNAISTQASILSEQAILIGGYTREAESNTTFKVPILGDMPLIGPFMRSRNSNAQKMTRLFLITPRIVPTAGASGSVSEQVGARLEAEPAKGLQKLVPRPAGRLSTELSGSSRDR